MHLSTESDIKIARYKRVEKEADDLGRLIGVRRLKPSEQAKVSGYTADLTGSDAVVGPNGEKFQVPHRLPLMIAAAVCMIDDDMIPFPRSRAELDSIYDRLDEEGVTAAGAAISRLQADESTDPKADAKN